MLFVKGQSGNPGGRVKIPPEVREAARALTKKAIRALEKALDEPSTRVTAAVALLDRGWGKPLQEISGELGMQINVAVLKFTDLAIEADEPKLIEATADDVTEQG